MHDILRHFLIEGHCWDDLSRKTYANLFERLDTNKDGKVDVAELRAGLIAMGISFRKGAAQVRDWEREVYPRALLGQIAIEEWRSCNLWHFLSDNKLT